ncbi:MAG: hypothetical protein KF901_06370 [Myxococcales bacterium]|nr:hypothetical protein [Myxococcales bacterium]
MNRPPFDSANETGPTTIRPVLPVELEREDPTWGRMVSPTPSPLPPDRSWEDETTGYGPDVTADLRSKMVNPEDLPLVDGAAWDDETTCHRQVSVPRRAFRDSRPEPAVELAPSELLPEDTAPADRTTRRPPARLAAPSADPRAPGRRPSHPYRRFPAPPRVPTLAPPTSAPPTPMAPVATKVAAPIAPVAAKVAAPPRPYVSPHAAAVPRPAAPRPHVAPASPVQTPPAAQALPSTPPRDADKRGSHPPVRVSASGRLLQWTVLALAAIGSVCVGWLLANLWDGQTPVLAPATLARTADSPGGERSDVEISALGAQGAPSATAGAPGAPSATAGAPGAPSAVVAGPAGVAPSDEPAADVEPAEVAPSVESAADVALANGAANDALAPNGPEDVEHEHDLARDDAAHARETARRDDAAVEASTRDASARATTGSHRRSAGPEESWAATPVPARVWPSTVGGGDHDRARSDHLVALARQARGSERRQLLWEAAHAHPRNPQVAFLFARDAYYEGDLEVAEAWARAAVSMRRRHPDFRALLGRILEARAAQ